MVRVALALLFFCLNVSLPAFASEIDELLAKVAMAYGDETTRQAPKGIRHTGMTYSNMRKLEGRIIRDYQFPDRLRIDIQYPGTEELRILNGPHAWKREQQMGKPFRDALILQGARMALPWNLLQARSELRDLGMQKLDDGQVLHLLELPMSDSVGIKVWIESQSGRVLRSLGTLSGSMGLMEFGTVYKDFRTQDGRLYAATEHHFVAGQPTGHTRIEHVEFPDVFPESLFIPPGPEAKSRQHI